eukprot:6175195-Pleurochrysis_carterae.AAC.1
MKGGDGFGGPEAALPLREVPFSFARPPCPVCPNFPNSPLWGFWVERTSASRPRSLASPWCCSVVTHRRPWARAQLRSYLCLLIGIYVPP